jgi:hypothetical protein
LGLLIDGVYATGRAGTSAEATTHMLRAYDVVTLVVILPALLGPPSAPAAPACWPG